MLEKSYYFKRITGLSANNISYKERGLLIQGYSIALTLTIYFLRHFFLSKTVITSARCRKENKIQFILGYQGKLVIKIVVLF